ncbi:MAG TPA: MinD/ParA family protein [Sedimentisphaerales bacterium]|nr:MinD/ParA family protein [Sedimentisphaerales bacterium]
MITQTLKESSHLHDLMKHHTHAKVLAVTSGKGGVGKTNIAANLGICLAASGKRVVLLDADLSLGNLEAIMNINSKYNISHMLAGRKTMDEIIHIGPEGLEIICGASGLADLADLSEFQRQRLLSELSTLQNNCDIIAIDTAAGISKSVVGLCLAANHVLVVTTPEAAAMTDAYAMIKVLTAKNFTGRISVVVNMADGMAEGRRTYRQIAGVAKKFLNTHIYCGAVLPNDDKLKAAVRLRKPVVLAYPRASITASLAALAAKLSTGSMVQADDTGFLRKVVDWFC